MSQNTAAATESGSTSLPRNVRILGAASLINDTASEIIFPLLPSFLLSMLGGNKFLLGVIEGAADSIASLLKLWSGGRSDQAGRRKGFVLFGYTLTTLTRPLIALIVAPWQLFLVRCVDRVGKGVRASARDALIADSTAPGMQGRAFGFNRSMDHLGAVIGPLIATGFLLVWPGQVRTLFLLTLVPGLLLVTLVALGLREQVGVASRREKLHLTLAPFEPRFRRFLLALVIFTLGNSSDAFLLVRAGELGVHKEYLPLLWGAFHVIKSCSNLWLGRMVDKSGPQRFIVAGWLVYGAVYMAFAFASEVWHVAACFLVYALYYGLTEPSEKKLVAILAGQQRVGLAYGWYNFTIGIATLPASLLFGLLYDLGGPRVAFGSGAALAILAVALLGRPSTPPATPPMTVA